VAGTTTTIHPTTLAPTTTTLAPTTTTTVAGTTTTIHPTTLAPTTTIAPNSYNYASVASLLSCGTILPGTLYSADSSIGNGSVLYVNSGLSTPIASGSYQLDTGTNVNVGSSGVVTATAPVTC
jgi:hypothetical protein